jgi:hypothetical protein
MRGRPEPRRDILGLSADVTGYFGVSVQHQKTGQGLRLVFGGKASRHVVECA